MINNYYKYWNGYKKFGRLVIIEQSELYKKVSRVTIKNDHCKK